MTPKSATDRFEFERGLVQQGIREIAGVDEAGRGPLAGPVVAAAVSFPIAWIDDGLPAELEGLNDSKQLTATQRERYFEFLHSSAPICFAIAQVEVDDIDRINILAATHRAMNQAIEQIQPQHVLMDGLHVKSVRRPQTALVKGDSRSYSIAAASVLAKVTRDRIMLDYDRQFPGYGFAEHKGYGTARHMAALAAHGPCPIHRRSFAPMRVEQPEFLF
jgi:ribonuclease HII